MVKKSIGTSVNIWLRGAAEDLAMAGIPTALLDAEIILAHTIRKSRTWLHAHSDELLEERRLDIANARLELRKERVPVAYIIGHKEFYGRLFQVNPSVLIPRPESEAIIELLKTTRGNKPGRLLDIGTGSGCLGVTAKLELPQLAVTLSDIDRRALKVAASNAEYLGADVEILQSDLFRMVAGQYDIILANLPYVDRVWERSPETMHEPQLALIAKDGGLAIITRLLEQSPAYLTQNGLLLIEADPAQHPKIIAQATSAGILKYTQTLGYALCFTKL